MAYPITEAAPRPPLDLTPTTRVYSGRFRIGPSGAVVVSIRHAYAMGGLVLGYRVTVQTPEPSAGPPAADLR